MCMYFVRPDFDLKFKYDMIMKIKLIIIIIILANIIRRYR